MLIPVSLASCIFLLSCLSFSAAVELTFELPDNAKECFYEEIDVGTEFTVEFQV
jgi:protein ERP2